MDLSALGSGAPGGRRELREAGRGLGELATGRQATEGFRSKASRMEGASSFSEGAGGWRLPRGGGESPGPLRTPDHRDPRLLASSLRSGTSMVTQSPPRVPLWHVLRACLTLSTASGPGSSQVPDGGPSSPVLF